MIEYFSSANLTT